MVVIHNLMAMNAQRQFNIVGIDKKKSTEKLSSGYKINRAADDAAGLTISEKVRSKIRALNQGSYNTQDGISWIQVADGAMAEGHDMMHRLKELSVYAANGTLTEEDRYAIDREVQGILDEIHRIDMSTQFNTKDVFLHGDVMFDVYGEPGDLEVYDAIVDKNGVTYGGFLFHGERIRFDQIDANMVRIEDGKQVFNGGTYKFTGNAAGEFFTIEVEDGAEVPEAKRRLTVTAVDKGIEIDGHLVEWSKMKDEDGFPVDPANPKRGMFSVPYGNSVLEITIGTNCSLRSKEEFIGAINKHESVTDNGGVSYSWITELEATYSRDALSIVPAKFAGDAVLAGSQTKRNIDNKMAYETNSDFYDSNLNDGIMEYKLVAELVETAENKRVHNDLANETETATKNGMDVKNQDIRLYLVGMDGKEIAGSSVLMSELQPNKITAEDWVKGAGLSDGDSCGDHAGWTYDSYDDVADKLFTYTDPSKKTDIKMSFKLSEVASPDSIAYNVELVSVGKIQDYNKGLNGTTYFQKFNSEFTDKMTVSDSDNKVSVRDNSTTYEATYDLNTTLGRNFDIANDILAKVDGNTANPGAEGNIVYDEAQKTISFAIKGYGNGASAIDKDSKTYADNKDTNNVDFFEFNVSTTKIEDDFVKSIVKNAETITNKKIDKILSGADSDKLVSLPHANETIFLYDNNVMTGKGLKASGREYIYDYEYADLMITFNEGKTNSNGAGEGITIKMSDSEGGYSSAMTEKDIENKYLKLKTDYKFTFEKTAHDADSYINAKDLTKNIGSIIQDVNGKLKELTFVYDELNDKYVDEESYKSVIANAVKDAKTSASLGGEEFIIGKNGELFKKSELKSAKKDEYNNAIDAVLKYISGEDTPYYETDSDGNIVCDENGDPKLLTNDKLKEEVLNRIDNSKLELSSLLYAKFEAIDDSKFITISGEFDAATLLASEYDDFASWADTLADNYVTDLKGKEYVADSENVLDAFIGTLTSCSDELKTIIEDNADFESIQGSFKIDASTLDKVINADTIAQNAKKSAIKLGTVGSPAIEEDNLKTIYTDIYGKAIEDLSANDEKTTDIISAVGFDGVKSELSLLDGKVSFSKEQMDAFKEKVVKELTDNELRNIEGYYGSNRVDGMIQRFVSGKDKDGYLNYLFNIDEIIGNKKATPYNVIGDAGNYVVDAMKDIAKTSTFTLETVDFATTEMTTKSEPGKISYARYNSGLEIEFLSGIDIQHSNDRDDFTTIQQFCFNTAVMRISNLSLKTQEAAKRAIGKVDYAISYISSKRSELGATQNRLEHTYNNNRNKEENLTAAESRIRDTDMAKEMMNNTKLSILEQMMTSVMAQANQSTQGVLALLQ